MGYHADRSIASLFDEGPLEDAADRMVERTQDALRENLRERTPVAVKPDAASGSEWRRARGGRRPGTARDSWRSLPIEGGRAVVESRDPVVRFLDEGTPPHTIRARNARSLRYWSSGPEANAEGVVFRRQVRHPGTEPLAIIARAEAETERDFERIGREEVERWEREVRSRS